MRRAHVLAFTLPGLVACCMLLAGCDDKKKEGGVVSVGGPAWQQNNPTAAPAPADSTAPAATQEPEAPPEPVAVPMGSPAASASQAAPKVDPDLAVIEQARTEGARCFGSGKKGTRRTATVRAFVMPSGSVSRAEVTASGASDAEVACLKRVGTSMRLAAKDVRTVDVDVEAVAP